MARRHSSLARVIDKKSTKRLPFILNSLPIIPKSKTAVLKPVDIVVYGIRQMTGMQYDTGTPAGTRTQIDGLARIFHKPVGIFEKALFL